LNNEVLDDPMKDTVVVVALQGKLDKIPTSFGGLFTPELNVQGTKRCLHNHFTLGPRFHQGGDLDSNTKERKGGRKEGRKEGRTREERRKNVFCLFVGER
jgi:hypothetical protein